MSFTRFIALGDSFTEGMCDEIIEGQYRGWADRVADVLTGLNKDFTYMNLAVRGKLLPQVIDDQLPIAKKYITGKDTLVAFHAGANDVLRPSYQPAIAKERYRKALSELSKTDAKIIAFTIVEEVDGKGKTADLWNQRFSDFNKNVRACAKEFGVTVIESQEAPWLADRRFLATDRLHLNPEGHFRIANGVLETLGLPFDPAWRVPLPTAKRKPKLKRISENTRWIITFVIPWIWRRIRKKSSGDGRVAKYLTPVEWSAK
jgi:lysophospholipase L1-like esterase